ncbi:YEATS domain-containing protein 4-like [Tropilaelaps mercedesae]|uniref:YEATS domain-containing protein 4-like n=1 Tax=Tropilaelaps mercedesae TaxID=418985 RepID=A0A1V9XPL6_9ACAR|nr:YEATS domain-containing protein 4-like [Tropilaelaps mercedesae]
MQVVFVLEPYYTNEEVFQPPFEIKRTGWGEFDVDIKLVFRHRSMRTLSLRHYLRLVEYAGSDQTPIYTNHMESENYDEIVISRPSAKIKALFRDESDARNDHISGVSSKSSRSTVRATKAIPPSTLSLTTSSSGLVNVDSVDPDTWIDVEVAEQDQHAARRITQLTNILRGQKKVLAEIHRVKDLLLKNHQEIRTLLALIETRPSNALKKTVVFASNGPHRE